MLRKLIGAISGAAFGIIEGATEGWRIGWRKQHIAGGFLTPYIVIGFISGLYVGFTYQPFSLPSTNVVIHVFYRIFGMCIYGVLFAFFIAIFLAVRIVRLGDERHIFKKEHFIEPIGEGEAPAEPQK